MTQTSSTLVLAYLSKLVVVSINVDGMSYLAFQINFRPDGSVFVNFPYFRHRSGILAAATIPANGLHTSEINLQKSGKATSHLVKYSHHSDGRVHFSQDGPVFTEIIRQSIPLAQYRGHLFTVIVQGCRGFQTAHRAKDKAPPTSTRTNLTFAFDSSPNSNAIKFVGYWYDLKDFPLDQARPNTVGPNFTAKTPSGEQHNGFLIGNPAGDGRHVLFLYCYQIPRVSSEDEILHFYGGFDSRETMDNVFQEAGFLTFIYPITDFDDLKKTIGTVDRF